MFTMNFLMYLGMGLGIFTAIGILIAGVSYLIQFIQHYRRLRVFVDEVIDWKNDLSHRIHKELGHDENAHPNYSTTSWCLKEFPKV